MSGSDTWVMHGGVGAGKVGQPKYPPKYPQHCSLAPLRWVTLMCKGKLRHGAAWSSHPGISLLGKLFMAWTGPKCSSPPLCPGGGMLTTVTPLSQPS